MTEYKSYEEVAKMVTETFGKDAEIAYEPYGMGWIICTGILKPTEES